jgi:hypothetical protein
MVIIHPSIHPSTHPSIPFPSPVHVLDFAASLIFIISSQLSSPCSLLPLLSSLSCLLLLPRLFPPRHLHTHSLLPSFPCPSRCTVSGVVKIWAADNMEHPLKFEGQCLSGAVTDLQWSPDSQRVVAVSGSTHN